MAGFEMRALNLPEYREVCSLLERLDSGDAAARRELASRLASAAKDPGFAERNPVEGVPKEWRRRIARLAVAGAPRPVETAAAIAIALLAMPSFQFSYIRDPSKRIAFLGEFNIGPEPVNASPSFVLLGEIDGALYRAMLSRDARVGKVFSPERAEPYPVMGEAMIILTRDEVSILHEVATRTKVSGDAEIVRTRLLALLEWSLAEPERAIAVSF